MTEKQTAEEYRRRMTLESLLKTRVTEHWGHRTRFTPRLIEKVYGDGKQALILYPMNERPRYWVVRVDSKLHESRDAIYDILDDIYDQIDEQFGRPTDSDRNRQRPIFPMFDCEGCCWSFVDLDESSK